MSSIWGMIEQCFGGRYVFRAFAEAKIVVKYSEPVEAYQRQIADQHVNDIAEYFKSGYNNYTPEIVLAYSIDDWYVETINPVFCGGMLHGGSIEPIDFLTGDNTARELIALSSSPRMRIILRDINGISFQKAGNLIKLTIPDSLSLKPFRRIDGNHRLNAFETLDNKTASSMIPISIVLIPNDHERGNSLRTEMELFHNINGKTRPLTNIEQVRNILKRDDGLDLELIKVDEHKDGYSDDIYHRIKTGIEKAELVIADLTYGNHNVHHEIGYAQGLGKKYYFFGAITTALKQMMR